MVLIALKGFSGSGKSALGRALDRRLGWPIVDKDDVKDVLHGRTPEANQLSYDVMFRIARRQLLQGSSVICDSPLNFPHLYEAARELAAETGASLVVVECRCPDERVWRRRIEDRKPLGLPEHHQTDWEAFQAYRGSVIEETTYPILDPHLAVDTTRPVAELIEEVLAWLGQLPRSHGNRETRIQ